MNNIEPPRIILEQAIEIFNKPFLDLIFEAQRIHRENFSGNEVQISTLLSIKTGSCPENCSYCPQSAHHNTGLKKEPLLPIEEVVKAAKKAKENGATRFCMGAAWRQPREDDLEKVCEMVAAVKELGLETCVTLGMLKPHQAEKLKKYGLDYYNHNIDTSEEFYSNIVTTRTFQDRLDTLEYVRQAGLKICCGGILGMGETNLDRIKMLVALANLPYPPESVPINKLVRIPGTALENQKDVDVFEFVRTIALARILMPKSFIRLAAGREDMSEEFQALCFIAGTNSIFYGEQLLTSDNKSPSKDSELFKKLGLQRLTA